MNNNFGPYKPFDTGSLFSSVDKLQSKKELRKQKKWESKKLFNNKQMSTAQASNNKQLQTSVHYDDMMEYASEDRKVRHFMWVAMPIIMIEIAAMIGLIVFFLALPKNFCRISSDSKDVEIYVNDKRTNKFRFKKPKEESRSYFFGVDVSVELPDGAEYIITYTITSDDCEAVPTTSATSLNGKYSLQVKGGVRTKILTGINVASSDYIEDFDVDIKINAEKV